MKNIKGASVQDIMCELMHSEKSRLSVNAQYSKSSRQADKSVALKIEQARFLIKEGKRESNLTLFSAENESWIAGYEGIYTVTRKGDVFSYHESRKLMDGAILSTSGKLRKTVLLCLDGKPKSHYVAKLVADAFIPRKEGDYYVRFTDEDTLNCFVENLYYCTKEEFYSENSQLGVLHKPNTTKETDYILRGVGEKLPGTRYRTVISRLTEQDLIDAGIPPEYLNFTTKDESIWKAYASDKTLIEAIDAGYSIKECVRIVGVCSSQVSSFKSGRRGAKQKAAYYKFKEYLKTVAESV